jgi:small-conductance mechanosensitive channel
VNTRRPLPWIGLAAAFVAASTGIRAFSPYPDVALWGVALEPVVVRGLLVGAVVAGFYGGYLAVDRAFVERAASKRRRHDLHNVLRLAFGAVTAVTVLGVVTEQWLGVLFSLGVVGFAVTFALQQPLLSLVAWAYIAVNQPYAVGDRVEIGGSRGDVIAVNFLVTTLWEVNGPLVSSHQPSGRVVTVPNSVVLSSQVVNYTTLFEYVWNELSVQVAYETDLDFAREVMVEEAEAVVGEEMRRRVARYRERLADAPVELEVRDAPTVNVVQEQSWVELRLRYVVHPRRGARTRNEIYQRVLDRFADNPDRVAFPVGRNR